MNTSFLSHPGITSGLKSLQSNVAYKLLFVNVTSMVLPRIYIDSQRNKYAGQETAFYETYSLATNYGLPGLLALGAAHAMKGVNNPLKVDPTGWIANENVAALSDIYQRSIDAHSPANTLDRFVVRTLENLEGVDSVHGRAIRLSPGAVERHAAHIREWLASGASDENNRKRIAKGIAESLGTFDRVALLGEGENKVGVQPEKLLDNLCYLSREFQKGHAIADKLTQADIQRNVARIAEKLQFANNVKAAVSLSVLAVVGFSAQFINKWITRRRTGKTGFVGYSDFGQDAAPNKNAPSSQTMLQSPAAFASRPVTPVQPPDRQRKSTSSSPSTPYFGGLAAQQFLPTAEQLKYVIYPAGIIGKLFASRCLDEARETAVKAGFAYFNFLFIPNFVENLAAHLKGNPNVFSKLPPAPETPPESWLEKAGNYLRRVNQSAVRSYEDIEIYAHRLGKELGALDASQLRERLNGVLKNVEPVLEGVDRLSRDEKTERIAKAVIKELHGIKNMATVSSLVYSCLTLGVGLNLLNAYITNRKQKKARMAETSPSLASAKAMFAPSASAAVATPAAAPSAVPLSPAPPFRPLLRQPASAFSRAAMAPMPGAWNTDPYATNPYATPSFRVDPGLNPFYLNQQTERIS